MTYWDQLGWKDRFATPANTQRRWDYAKGLRHDQVWTPQIVVNGRADITGTKSVPLGVLLAATPRVVGPAHSVADGSVKIAAGSGQRTPADIWLVRYDPRTQEVAVKAGENGGRILPHPNIVRELTRLGRWSGTAASFKLSRAPAGLATAILVQMPRGGPILAAACD